MGIRIFFTAILACHPLLADWTPEQKQIIQAVLPTRAESAWQNIHWRTNLWEARQEAAKQGKPIYLWEMDGHPLGCT